MAYSFSEWVEVKPMWVSFTFRGEEVVEIGENIEVFCKPLGYMIISFHASLKSAVDGVGGDMIARLG